MARDTLVNPQRAGAMEAGRSCMRLLDHVTVRAPATTANLGPGFDIFGLALDVWQHCTLRTSNLDTAAWGAGEGGLTVLTFSLTVTGRDAALVPKGRDNLLILGLLDALRADSVATVMQAATTPMVLLPRSEVTPGVGPVFAHIDIQVDNHIPVCRGMGSSAASLIAGLVGGFGLRNLLGDEHARRQAMAAVWRLAAAHEGHGDNAAACALGGLQVRGVCVGVLRP